MALQHDITYRGLTIYGACIRVNSPRITPDKQTISFGVCYFSNINEIEEIYSEQYECPYVIEGGNPFKQAYDFLKLLNEFSGSIDIDD